jgi:hypothetical protein
VNDERFAELGARLDARGIDSKLVIEHGAQPIAERVQSDLAPWLDAVERYAIAIAARPDGSLWSATRFVIAPLADVAGADVAAFSDLLDRTGALLVRSTDSRLEQHALRTAAAALADRPHAMAGVLDAALELARLGIDAGWYVQLVVPALAIAAPADGAFTVAWQRLAELARDVHAGGMHVGYPLATGIAALIARGDLEALPRWLDVLAPLARAAKDRAYPLFEYSITGLAQGSLESHEIIVALELGLAMFDYGLFPGPTLAVLASPIQLDVASRLAKAGVDPAIIIENGVRLFESCGWLDDGGDRLVALAIEMHRRGLRRLLFEDGLYVIETLERERGLGMRALELIEAMVARDLEPGVLMRWSLPRTLGFVRPAWSAAELLWLAEQLVAAGIEPEPAVGYAARPMIELAADADEFRRVAATLIELVVRLDALGVDHRSVLFHDVAALADSGGESRSFVDLLGAVSALLAAWTAAKLDPTELLQTALPTAARECVGKPWVLATALQAATRLAAERRGDEAIALLAIGVHTAAQLGATNADELATALATLEQRYAALPAKLTAHASAAAGVLAGTDIHALDRALAAIGEACTRHGAKLVAIGDALPQLARIAGELDGFVALIDSVIDVGPRAHRLALVAAQVCRNAGDGRRAIAELAAWEADDRARAFTLDSIGALARVAAPATLAACVALVHDARTGVEHANELVGLLAHARDEAALRKMCELLPPLVRDGRYELRDGLYAAGHVLARSALGWTHLVAPAIATAKAHAGPLLYAIATIPARAVEREADAAVVRDLVTQRGVRAIDLLYNLVLPALARNIIGSLAEHRDRLDRYLREVGFVDAEVYAHFLAIEREPAKIASLRGEVAALTEAIRRGDVSAEQRAHGLFGVALQRVFPASVSATREMWIRLATVMPDRPGDVDALFPDSTAPLELAAGGWQLVAGATGLDAFAWCAEVLPDSDAPAVPLVELGWQLLTAWADGRLARQKLELARALLGHSPAGTLPAAAYDSAAQLLAIRALAADRLATLVEAAVVEARASDLERAERLIRTRLAPTPRINAGLVKAIARTLAGDPGQADRRLRGQLQAFELPDDIVARLAAAPDLAIALQQLTPRSVEIEPGKEITRIHGELVGQELQQMNATIARVLEYRASADVLRLDTSVTKRAVHAPIGLTEGVCVAVDDQLWNTPGFMHLALWDGTTCVGGVHLLVVEEDGARYLALPGINPASSLLDRVEADVLTRALLDRCRELAARARLAGVWIPTAPSIHSNRHAIGAALEALALPARATRGHPFSYRPYAYRIDTVWQLPER